MKNGKVLIGYGVFLIVAGLAGYLSNPEKAKTALMSGGLFGVIQIVLGVIAMNGRMLVAKIGLGVCVFLALTFAWRATVSWMAVMDGNADKLFAAVLISVMLIASIVTALLLLTKRGGSQGV